MDAIVASTLRATLVTLVSCKNAIMAFLSCRHILCLALRAMLINSHRAFWPSWRVRCFCSLHARKVHIQWTRILPIFSLPAQKLSNTALRYVFSPLAGKRQFFRLTQRYLSPIVYLADFIPFAVRRRVSFSEEIADSYTEGASLQKLARLHQVSKNTARRTL